jgi:hypothetical protein
MQPTRNTPPQDIRTQSGGFPLKHLAASVGQHAQRQPPRWNMRGPGFIAVHRAAGDANPTSR